MYLLIEKFYLVNHPRIKRISNAKKNTWIDYFLLYCISSIIGLTKEMCHRHTPFVKHLIVADIISLKGLTVLSRFQNNEIHDWRGLENTCRVW